MEDLLFDTTILQVFNVVLSFYAVSPAAVEYWGVDEDELRNSCTERNLTQESKPTLILTDCH